MTATDGDASRGELVTAKEPLTHDELNRLFADPPGLKGQLTGVQNDKIGIRLLLTASSSCCWGAASTRCSCGSSWRSQRTPSSAPSCTRSTTRVTGARGEGSAVGEVAAEEHRCRRSSTRRATIRLIVLWFGIVPRRLGGRTGIQPPAPSQAPGSPEMGARTRSTSTADGSTSAPARTNATRRHLRSTRRRKERTGTPPISGTAGRRLARGHVQFASGPGRNKLRSLADPWTTPQHCLVVRVTSPSRVMNLDDERALNEL